MALISLENMEFFAYHGCFKEEQIIGNKFIVNLEMEVDTRKAEDSDNLEDTVNYQKVYNVIREEMQLKSKLVENIAKRIISSIYKHFSEVTRVKIKISKINPPIGGKVENVSVTIEK